MNFLSHYLLDASWISDGELFGTVLVDIARLRGQGFRLKAWPEGSGLELEEVRAGILRHYEVDAWWHNSRIFHRLTEIIKEVMVAPAVPPLPRNYFFAHIAAEMLLDRVFMQGNGASVREYYGRLGAASLRLPICDILALAGNPEWAAAVEREVAGFISSRFLEGYANDGRFTATVFEVYGRTAGFAAPDAAMRPFRNALPEMERLFRISLNGAGLPDGALPIAI